MNTIIKNPLISIVISYYNDEKYLATAIESILKQSYQNFELILFNHASTDSSRDIAHSYEDKRIIHIDGHKNLGAGSSYNFQYILPYMHGEYYKTFCADDIMPPDCLDNLIEYAKLHPEKDLIWGNMEYVDAQAKSLKKTLSNSVKKVLSDISEIDLMKLLVKEDNIIAFPTVLIKIDKYKQIKHDNSLTLYADVYLWLSMLVNQMKVGYCDKVLVFYRCHEYQESSLSSIVITQRRNVEKVALLPLFFNLKSIDVVKEVFSDSAYIEKLTEEKDIPFIVAEYFFSKYGYQFAYLELFKMLQDKNIADRLNSVFGFDVLSLRKIYAFPNPKKSFKQRIFSKSPKKLTMIELLFLLIRRMINDFAKLITLSFIRKKI